MKTCPFCKQESLWRDSADIGVGIIYSPYGCTECGWSEDEDYNQLNNPLPRTDQWGRIYPKGSKNDS